MSSPFPAEAPRTLRASTVAVAIASAICLAVMLSRGAGLRFVSGSWTALAVDAAQGTLYRPVIGPLGYGGTRYMPLHFAVHGLLIDGIGDPALAGAILTVVFAFGLVSGVYALLRALGVAQRLAVCGAVLGLASLASQLAITTIRGDLLPAALNVWGLACIARQVGREQRHVAMPALLFALAFSAKQTTLFGVAASVATLALQGDRKSALRLTALCVAGIVAVVAVIYVASDGRVIESMRACGSGGAGFADLLKAPLTFLMFACMDLGFFPFFLASVTAIFSTWPSAFRTLPAQSVFWTLAATVCIFGSPGIDFNHLLDLHIACVVYLVVQWSNSALPRFPMRLFSIAGFVSSAAILIVCGIALYAFPAPLQQDRLDAYNAARGGNGPVLSEDPWVPIVGGERPYLLDPFNLRLVCAQDARVREDLWRKLEDQYFGGVVLTPIENPSTREFEMDGTWMGTRYYGGLHFPAEFIDRLLQHYEPAARFHSYLVLKPKKLP